MDQLKKRGCTLFIFLFLCPFSLYLPHLRYFFSFLLSKESFTPVCLLLHSCLSRFVTLIPSIFILWLILCFVFSLQGFHCCSSPIPPLQIHLRWNSLLPFQRQNPLFCTQMILALTTNKSPKEQIQWPSILRKCQPKEEFRALKISTHKLVPFYLKTQNKKIILKRLSIFNNQITNTWRSPLSNHLRASSRCWSQDFPN